MIIKQVRVSQQAKDQLSRLKAKTGIKNWNILCRWALSYSFSENTIPTDIPIVEIWEHQLVLLKSFITLDDL